MAATITISGRDQSKWLTPRVEGNEVGNLEEIAYKCSGRFSIANSMALRFGSDGYAYPREFYRDESQTPYPYHKEFKFEGDNTPIVIQPSCYSASKDFQDSHDDKEDTRSSHEYLNDLEEEYQARTLLHKPELRPTKEFKAKYNKIKAKLALLSLSASASKAVTVKNKGLIVEAHEWDEEEVLSDDNEMVDVKVLMALSKENNPVSKEGARNGEWVKISIRKRVLGVDQLTEDPFSSRQKDLVFVKSLANDTKVSILGVERPWLSKAKDFIMPNHDIGKILPAESQRNTIDSFFTVTNSSATDYHLAADYDLADESSVCSTPLPPLKKLDGAEPISGPKIIKSILRSKSTLKAESLKGVIINEPSSTPAKGNKNSPASVVNSALAGKLKSVKIKDDPHLAIVMKELNNLKLQFSKNQPSYSRSSQP
uniref:Retrovirus-related Pol polyprotein from transposon TNT 1-94 n=1 Tax=Tanacetum cinerariifolium TaxID=118510 RepID=A0A6L2N0L8_TANCI|nr:hypothetical protein [Tanacetum cinerariifolium]